MCKIHKINIPKLATKQLKLQSCSAGKKLVVSTNWLPLFGFEAKCKIIEEIIAPNMGIRIKLATEDDTKPKRVYSREYKNRRNNPLETMLDIRGQKLLNEAFPQDTKNVHILFIHGEILITPIADKKAEAIKKFKQSKDPLNTFLACSSGVDGHSLQKQGFSIETLLEFRPNEARDKTKDFSETGALAAISNISPKTLINEDIMALDLDKIASLTQKSEHSFFHLSIQCDDFSNAKANSLKDKSLEDNSSTLDMILDGLNLIQKFNFPVVLIENVRGFATSDIGKMTKVRLQRLGYKIYDEVSDARDYGGLTSRVRYYLVATLLPTAFKIPQKTQRNEVPIWSSHIQPLIEKDLFRIPTSTKSLEDGIKCGRARVISDTSMSIPTVLKSQNRMAKDSVFAIDGNGTILFPKVAALSHFMGIDERFNLNAVSDTIASEIVGQSIDVPMHEAWTQSVLEHISNAHNILNNKLF